MTKAREPVDMTAEAVGSRLEQVGALYRLMASLRTARIAGVELASESAASGGEVRGRRR